MKAVHFALAFAIVTTCSAQDFAVEIHSAGPLPGGPFNSKVVTGKPFTADAVLETNQTLTDGTKIANKRTISVARDSQGRTRREETLPSPSSDAPPLKTVVISDPVAQVNYVLGPDGVAHKFPFSKGANAAGISISTGPVVASQGTRAGQQFTTAIAVPGSMGEETSANLSAKQPGDAVSEALGTQNVNGVTADGKRTTLTIPIGEIGNDSPLVITTERWYSQDLQALILSRQTDPRFGESSFQLTNIQRAEPPASLFQIPSDYTVEQPR